MAQIEKRKNGSYRFRSSLGYTADGKHHKTQSMTWWPEKGMTAKQIEKALQEKAREFDEQCRSGKRVVNNCKLETFINEWFEIKQGEITESTAQKYRDYCPRVNEHLGHMRMDKISTYDIDKFIVWLRHQTYGKKYGRYFIFFLLAIYTGARRGEVIALRWSDIDFDQNIVRITRTLKYSKKKGNYYTAPKSEKSRRTVLISDDTIQELLDFKKKQEEHAQKIGDKWHDEDLIFTQFNGKQMGISTPYGFIKKFAEKYGLVPTTIHQLRHTNATILIHNGTDIKTLQEWLGHSSAQTTLDIYSHDLQAA